MFFISSAKHQQHP
jgi:hypothetical protein